MLDSPLASELTPDERLKQIAAILARGVRRYHLQLRRSESCTEKEVPRSSANGLEVGDDPRLSVSRRIGV